MAKKKSENTEVLQDEVVVPVERKYKLKGLLVWGSIVYSDADDAVFPITDEIAEQLLTIKPELIQLFDVQQ